MFTIQKRNIIALGAAGALLVGAGTAVAATGMGPVKSPPVHALQQGGMGYGLMAGGVVMDAAADYIGISETALVTARHDGKSLAEIAVENGKTAAGLQTAVVAAFKTNLDKAVAAGRITDAQAAQALATFQSQVQTMIDRTATGPVNGRGAGVGPGMGMGMGMGMGAGLCGGRR
jgi:hypothetical protein